jgi:hypothetical protein
VVDQGWLSFLDAVDAKVLPFGMTHCVHEKVPAALQMDRTQNLFILVTVGSVLPEQ